MTQHFSRSFDIDFERGKVGEDLVGTFLEDVAGSLIEVKTDYRAHETGNVYIETWQESGDRWKPSGINTTGSKFYALAGGSGRGFIVIGTPHLERLAREAPERTIATDNINSVNTKGRLVKVADIVDTIFREEN